VDTRPLTIGGPLEITGAVFLDIVCTHANAPPEMYKNNTFDYYEEQIDTRHKHVSSGELT